MMSCKICKSENIKLLAHIPGHDGEYEIFRCLNCAAHFSSNPPSDPYHNYKEFYSAYLAQANKIKKESDPLQFLLDSDPCYLPVRNAIRDKKKLSILEVGCGYGYLTYALRKLGHNAEGIDITKEAIKFATENFGNYYRSMPVEACRGEYDLVIALETIEHVPDVFSFLIACTKLLKPDGKIILTTPNKDYYTSGVWQTEKPPIHLSWLSRKTFEVLAEKLEMKVHFADFRPFISKRERDNKLTDYFMKNLPETFTASSFSQRLWRSLTLRNFWWLLPTGFFTLLLRLLDFELIRYMCNLGYRKFLWHRGGSITLGMVMTQK